MNCLEWAKLNNKTQHHTRTHSSVQMPFYGIKLEGGGDYITVISHFTAFTLVDHAIVIS